MFLNALEEEKLSQGVGELRLSLPAYASSAIEAAAGDASKLVAALDDLQRDRALPTKLRAQIRDFNRQFKQTFLNAEKALAKLRRVKHVYVSFEVVADAAYDNAYILGKRGDGRTVVIVNSVGSPELGQRILDQLAADTRPLSLEDAAVDQIGLHRRQRPRRRHLGRWCHLQRSVSGRRPHQLPAAPTRQRPEHGPLQRLESCGGEGVSTSRRRYGRRVLPAQSQNVC